MWTDSRDGYIPPLTGGHRLNADSFLHKELYPLVETLFNTRTDRSGRGVIGFSMGGWGASLQAMEHPDRYSYLSAASQIYNAFDAATLVFEFGFQYQITQGYDDPITNAVMWKQNNPADIDTNLRGSGIKYLITAGDGCAGLQELLSPTPECQGQWSAAGNTLGSAAEISAVDSSFEYAKTDLPRDGVPFQAVLTPGTHGANNARMFADYIVAQANATFATHTPTPTQFSYLSAWPQFSVWGYDVSVDRAQAGFLTMSNARSDGTALTVTGSGAVHILTPGRFGPGQSYTVTTTESGVSTASTATADVDRRLAVTVDLGSGADRTVTIQIT
jgi:hypothetical protein